MEYDLEIAERRPTLLTQIFEWNRIEDTFKKGFGEESLGDRDFKKMKLKEFDNIWYQFEGKPLTKDEKAMQLMLRFQRRKIRRALYPGLLGRIYQRTASFLSYSVFQVHTIPNTHKDDAYRFANKQIPIPENMETNKNAEEKPDNERYKPIHRQEFSIKTDAKRQQGRSPGI